MTALLDSARIIELDAFRPEAALRDPASEERARTVCREKLFVQVILCDREPELVGRTWSSRAVRVNADYVEFLGERSLPVGSLVDLWVDVASRPGKFFLSGRVRWTRPSEGERALVGIELQDGAATDYDSWRDLHA